MIPSEAARIKTHWGSGVIGRLWMSGGVLLRIFTASDQSVALLADWALVTGNLRWFLC